MKTKAFWALAAIGAMTLPGFQANAQETVVVEEETVALTEVPCKTHYYSNGGDNWFIQLGAGVTSPFVENKLPNGDQKHHLTAVYNVGFGKWFSPYIGWRLSFLGGSLHWDNQQFNHAKWVNANLDFMWDMFNSFGGVNSKRVFSIVPFIGLGGAYTWDYSDGASTVLRDNGKVKRNSWSLPLSAGIQLRLRLCKYVDFFADCRAAFMADNFNTAVQGDPIEANVSVTGGLSITFGGRKFTRYNPCDYLDYINTLNGRVNDLRGELAATTAALAAAEAQLPCPEVSETTIIEQAPMLSAVRFRIDSSNISDEEMVNIYNCAQWMKANPDVTVVVQGYADRDTGTAPYNMQLSQRRCQSVVDALVNKYGIDPSRLVMEANGSDVQPYDVNNWNRIVLFTQPD